MKYPPAWKDAIVEKMLQPNGQTIPELAEEEEISVKTLYRWRKEAQGRQPGAETKPKGGKSNPVTEAQAKNIAKAVLARHDIAISDEWILGEMAYYLSVASHGKRYWYDNVVKHNDRHERRCKRIKQIEKLLDAYRLEKNLYDESKVAKLPHDTTLLEMDVRRQGIEQTLSDLESLLNEERDLCSHFPKVDIEDKSPGFAKNTAAEKIFLMLCQDSSLNENKLKVWDTCEVIADMLIDAGLESIDRQKNLKRSLYDKLKRRDINKDEVLNEALLLKMKAKGWIFRFRAKDSNDKKECSCWKSATKQRNLSA